LEKIIKYFIVLFSFGGSLLYGIDLEDSIVTPYENFILERVETNHRGRKLDTYKYFYTDKKLTKSCSVTKLKDEYNCTYYIYGDNGKLSELFSYVEIEKNNKDITTFFYKENLLIKTNRIFWVVGVKNTETTMFYYRQSFLIKKVSFSNNKKVSETIYKYRNRKLSRIVKGKQLVTFFYYNKKYTKKVKQYKNCINGVCDNLVWEIMINFQKRNILILKRIFDEDQNKIGFTRTFYYRNSM